MGEVKESKGGPRKVLVMSWAWVEVEGTFCEWGMITERGCVVRRTRSPRWWTDGSRYRAIGEWGVWKKSKDKFTIGSVALCER